MTQEFETMNELIKAADESVYLAKNAEEQRLFDSDLDLDLLKI